MIPKIIHYCWFGRKPLPPLAQKCKASWEKYCPDYKIMEWNEDNFDINSNTYVAEAYEAKKWAFVSDYVRLWALVTYGGIYMDTDCEIIKPIDEFLSLTAVSGFEAQERISTALMGCQKEFEFFKDLLRTYENRHFKLATGNYDYTTNVTMTTKELLKHGLVLNNVKQTISGFTLFPTEYFCPKDVNSKKIRITKNTYAIHHFEGSWKSPMMKAKNILLKILGSKLTNLLVYLKHKLYRRNQGNT